MLRFLQLLCEGHHAPLQNYLREQPGNNPVNIVDDIMRFLKEVISGRMEELIFGTAIQTFHTLTELCQGPCPENQAALVARNVMSDINEVLQSSFPARDPTLVFELRCAATLTLLSLLEGCNEQVLCRAVWRVGAVTHWKGTRRCAKCKATPKDVDPRRAAFLGRRSPSANILQVFRRIEEVSDQVFEAMPIRAHHLEAWVFLVEFPASGEALAASMRLN